MVATGIAPYYRHFDLPWTPSEETEQRFRISLRNALIAFAVIGIIFPFIPLPDRKPAPPALPDRVVQLVIEKRTPPPPPPPPKEEEKPKPVEAEKPKPEPKPEPKPKVEPPKPDARERAQKALADLDMSAFTNNAVIDKVQQATNLSAAVTEQTRSERAMLTSKVGVGSGGINNAALSRGYGGSTGALKDQGTTQVSSSLGVGTGQGEARRTGASGKGARSREEVELEFDRNKGAIYQIYTRALRENPDLKGKVVLEITIAPSGQVTDCKVISSELNDPELERRLVARVKTFRFSAREVESLTLTKPIDFFPAG